MQATQPSIHIQTINTFLAQSRAHFALPLNSGESQALPLISRVASTSKRIQMISYRKLVQSLVIAAGAGVFAAGAAMADPGCGHMGNHHSERHVRMMEQHHALLHDAMKLSAEQEPAWKKLMDSEQPRMALSGGQPEDWAKLNAPERAEKMLELSKARQAQMAEHVAALKEFYALLTPEQQKTFEEFHGGPRRGMGGKPGPKAPAVGKAPSKS